MPAPVTCARMARVVVAVVAHLEHGRRERRLQGVADRGDALLAGKRSGTGHGRTGLNGRTSVRTRSEEHTSELQSLMRISYAVFCLKNKIQLKTDHHTTS